MIKAYNINLGICPACKEDGSLFRFKYLPGIANTKPTKACENCYKEYFESVKSPYFVEEYKGNKIYKYGDHYLPYWECQYAFNTLEECKARIDNNHVAIM